MISKIISINLGHPETIAWNEKSIMTSMLKHPVAGPIRVEADGIENNSFSNPQFHGTSESVLYAYGMSSAQKFMDALNGQKYVPGSSGETLTLDQFDEAFVSVGDVFQIGSVVAQATLPRIPCGKLNFRFQNSEAQNAMKKCLASGIYFKILKPGVISMSDSVERIEISKHPFSILNLYKVIVENRKWTPDEKAMAEANEAFSQRIFQKYST